MRVFSLIFLSLCSICFARSRARYNNAGNSTYVEITIDPSKVAGNETDFPVLITESNLVGAFWDKVLDGSDIFCTLEDATKLKRELVTLNKDARKLELYVKIPSLSGSINTTFRLHFGNSSLSETNDTDTWNSNFEVVMHMQEDAAAVAAMLDSTSNSNDGVISGQTVWLAEDVPNISPDIEAHDGFCTDGVFYYVLNPEVASSIKKYDSGWNLLATNTNVLTEVGLTDPNAGFTAGIEDGDIFDGKLYIVCQYADVDLGGVGAAQSQRIGIWNTSDLSFDSQIDISSNNQFFSSLTIDFRKEIDSTIYAYLPEFTGGGGGSDTFYAYTFPDFVYTVGANITIDNAKNFQQGLTIYNGYFYMTRGADDLFQVEADGTIFNIVWQIDPTYSGGIQGLDWVPQTQQIGVLIDEGGNERVHFLDIGKINQGLGGAGNSIDKLVIAADASLNISGDITVEMWAQLDNVDPARNEAGFTLGENDRDFFLKRNAAGDFVAYWDSSSSWLESTLSLTRGTKYYLSWIGSPTNWMRFYNAGSLLVQRTHAGAWPALTSNKAEVLSADANAYNVIGKIDELRVSSKDRGANWLLTSFNNQNSPSTFYSVRGPFFSGLRSRYR